MTGRKSSKGLEKAFRELIDKRVYNFSYLSRVHGLEGGEASPHWMNVMSLDEQDIKMGQGYAPRTCDLSTKAYSFCFAAPIDGCHLD